MLSPASSSRTKEKRFSAARESSVGKIISFTKVWSAASGFYGNAPYFIALIELENKNKERFVGQVVDSDDIKTGMKVEACMRKINVDGKRGILEYGTKFRVVK